jgi:hypothetical protein
MLIPPHIPRNSLSITGQSLPDYGSPPSTQEFCTPMQGKGDNHPSPTSPSKRPNRQPICANPLAAEDNPALCPQRMFHAVSVKAPLPPGEGGTDEINIVIDNLPAKLINHLKNQWLN